MQACFKYFGVLISLSTTMLFGENEMTHQLFDLIYPSRKSLYEWLVEVKKDGLDREKELDGFKKFLEDTVVCFEREIRCRLEPDTMETSHRDVRRKSRELKTGDEDVELTTIFIRLWM